MSAIEARLIIEILGRPKDHIKKTLGIVIEQLDKEKGVSVKRKTIHDPIEVKDSKDLFTTFAEVEAEFESINILFGIVFAYLPSNVEIMSPTSLRFTNDEMSGVASNILARMHFYENVSKSLVSQRDILANKLKSMGVDISSLQIPQRIKIEEENREKNKESSKKGKKKKKTRGKKG